MQVVAPDAGQRWRACVRGSYGCDSRIPLPSRVRGVGRKGQSAFAGFPRRSPALWARKVTVERQFAARDFHFGSGAEGDVGYRRHQAGVAPERPAVVTARGTLGGGRPYRWNDPTHLPRPRGASAARIWLLGCPAAVRPWLSSSKGGTNVRRDQRSGVQAR